MNSCCPRKQIKAKKKGQHPEATSSAEDMPRSVVKVTTSQPKFLKSEGFAPTVVCTCLKIPRKTEIGRDGFGRERELEKRR